MNKNYIYKLARHPGLPIAIAFTILGLVAGGLGGAVIMGALVWPPVLLTARD